MKQANKKAKNYNQTEAKQQQNNLNNIQLKSDTWVYLKRFLILPAH